MQRALFEALIISLIRGRLWHWSRLLWVAYLLARVESHCIMWRIFCLRVGVRIAKPHASDEIGLRTTTLQVPGLETLIHITDYGRRWHLPGLLLVADFLARG